MAYSPPQPYRTPDGRSLALPPEVAAGFVGLEPAAAPPDEPRLPPQQPGPPPGAAPGPGLMPPAAPSEAPMPEAPVQQKPAPEAAPTPPPGRPANNAAPTAPVAPGSAAGQPAPTTLADIRRGGYAPVLEQQQAAVDKEREAGIAQIQADQRQGEAEAKALAESNAREVVREQARAAAQQATMADIARRSAAIDGEIDRISKMKIDASVRSPALGAISLALGAIGSALAGKPGANPALDIMTKQIDTNVQRQLAERDAQMKAVGMRRDQISGLRQQLTDTNALYDGLAAAETRRVRNEIARIGAASKSDAVKANLLKLDATLASKEADHLAGAKDKQFALDERERQAAEARAARAQAAQQHRESMGLAWAQFGRQSLNDDRNYNLARDKLMLDAAQLEAQGKASEAKLLREKGIGGAVEVVRDKDGNVVTDKDGTPQTKYTSLKNRDGSPWIPNGSDGAIDKLRTQKAAADSIISVIDDVQRMGPEWLSDAANSEKLQKMKTLWASAKLETKDFKDLGVLAGEDLNLIEDFLGTGDPTRFKSSKAGIAQARKNILNGLNSKLRAHGFDGEYAPKDLGTLTTATTSPIDESSKQALGKVSQMPTDQLQRDLGIPEAGLRDPESYKKYGGDPAREIAGKLREAGGILPSVRANLDLHAKLATTSADPKARENSLAWLERAANTSAEPAVRAYASSLLTDRVLGDVTAPKRVPAAPDPTPAQTPEQGADFIRRNAVRR